MTLAVPDEHERRPSRALRALERVADRPKPRPLQATRRATKATVRVVPFLPHITVGEIPYVLHGLVALLQRLADFVHCTELREAAKQAEGNERAKAMERVVRRSSIRGRFVTAAVLVLLGLATWLYFYSGWALAAVTVVLLAVGDAIGHKVRKAPAAKAVHLPQPRVQDMSLGSLRKAIVESFEAQGYTSMTVAMPTPNRHGWDVEYSAQQPVGDDQLRQLERDLNLRRHGIMQIVDRENAARGTLSLSWRDPLGEVVYSPEPASTLSIRSPLALGVTASGEEWCENFLRTHFVLVGVSQSGKSSCLWQIIDQLRRCPEVELYGIDLSDGPAFGAPRRAFRDRAFDVDAAARILRRGVELCKERNAELKRRAEAPDRERGFEEKWQPTREAPQVTILIDEFARIAESDRDNSDDKSYVKLLPLVEYILRYGAKAAVTIGAASQGSSIANDGDFGKRAIRSQFMLRILFACDRQAPLDMFGKDARDLGWRPDLLEPANGAAINDAGKCYVMSALSNKAEMRRAYRLDQDDVYDRDDAFASVSRASAHEPEVIDVPEIPAVLAAVEAAFNAAGRPERMPSTELAAAVVERGFELPGSNPGAKLAELLRPHGLAPRETRWRPTPDANPVRGYYWADVQAAIEAIA